MGEHLPDNAQIMGKNSTNRMKLLRSKEGIPQHLVQKPECGPSAVHARRIRRREV